MTKLPYGVKTLAEIDCTADPIVRIIFLGILLEHLLRRASANNGDSFEALIRLHADEFSSGAYAVHAARWVRNQVIHGSGRVTKTHIDKANTVLKNAVRDILRIAPEGEFARMIIMNANPKLNLTDCGVFAKG